MVVASFRFAHLGVAFGLLAAGLTAYQMVQAAGSTGEPSSLVPIAPCRLVDTRPSTLVGNRATPLDAGQVADFAVWGTNGNCTVPSSATGIATNVTAVGPTASGYLTVYPGDVARPTTSNLNFVPGSPPTPNQVTVGLSASGGIKVFNFSGSVDVIIDIVGYYVVSPTGAGPQGPVGPQGPSGVNAVNPARVITVATSGGNFTSPVAALSSITDNSSTNPYVIRIAPGTYDTGTTPVRLKNFVDIEGSGQGTTTISCACASAVSPDANNAGATLRADPPATVATITSEVRDLTVVNRGGGVNGVAVWTGNTSGKVTLRNVTATAAGGSNANIAAFLAGSSSTLDGLNGQATGGAFAYGVYFLGGTVSSVDLAGSASGGSLYNVGIVMYGTIGSFSRVVATGSGGPSAYGMQMLNATPTMSDVTTTATGSPDSVGLNLATSSPNITRLTSTATGSGSPTSTSYGIYLDSTADPTLTDAAVTATNAHTAAGARVAASSPTWNGGSATATATNIDGSTEAASGISFEGSGSAVVRNVVVNTQSVAGTSSAAILTSQTGGLIRLDGVRATASGTSATGVLINSFPAAQIAISSSQISGALSSVTNNSGGTTNVKVSNSSLNASVSFVITCAFVSNSSTGGTLNSTCG